MKDQSLASSTEVSEYYSIHPFILTRWIRRGCPIRREKPYILDLEAVESWRREQGMKPVEIDEVAQ